MKKSLLWRSIKASGFGFGRFSPVVRWFFRRKEVERISVPKHLLLETTQGGNEDVLKTLFDILGPQTTFSSSLRFDATYSSVRLFDKGNWSQNRSLVQELNHQSLTRQFHLHLIVFGRFLADTADVMDRFQLNATERMKYWRFP